MGWNGSDRVKGEAETHRLQSISRPQSRTSLFKRCALAGFPTLIVGFLVVRFVNFERTTDIRQESDIEKPTRITEVKPAVSGKIRVETPQVKKTKSPKQANFVKMTPKQREEYIDRKLEEAPLPSVPTNGRLRTVTENQIANIFTKQLGDKPPPLVPIPFNEEARLKEILDAVLEIKETDTERQGFRKEAVALAREELKKFLAEGGTVTEFIEYYHRQLKVANQTWQNAQLQAIQTVKNDPVAAPAIIQEINEKLAAEGIKPLNLPKPMLRQYGVEMPNSPITKGE